MLMTIIDDKKITSIIINHAILGESLTVILSL